MDDYRIYGLVCGDCHKPIIIVRLSFNSEGAIRIDGVCRDCKANVALVSNIQEIIHKLFFKDLIMIDSLSKAVN